MRLPERRHLRSRREAHRRAAHAAHVLAEWNRAQSTQTSSSSALYASDSGSKSGSSSSSKSPTHHFDSSHGDGRAVTGLFVFVSDGRDLVIQAWTTTLDAVLPWQAAFAPLVFIFIGSATFSPEGDGMRVLSHLTSPRSHAVHRYAGCNQRGRFVAAHEGTHGDGGFTEMIGACPPRLRLPIRSRAGGRLRCGPLSPSSCAS